MSPSADERLFQIQTCQRHGYYAGHFPNRTQALIGQSFKGMIVIAVFDLGGNLLKVTRRNLPTNLLTARPVAGYDVDEFGFQQFLIREFGFRMGAIRVRPFQMPEERLGVLPLPEHFEEFLKHPDDSSLTEVEREEYPELISKWIDSGSFILECGNSYWLNKDGECEGS